MRKGNGTDRENSMGTERNSGGKTGRAAVFCIHFFCILAVMAAAVLVRLPSALYDGNKAGVKEAYTDEAGIPYLTDLDSYYHTRLVRNYLENGTLGDTKLEDGTAWDSLRFYPEGSSANYQPGIVWLTAGIWRIFGGSLEELEFRLVAVFAAFTALAAYLLGWRIGGITGGLTAGLLVGCGPTFALRTCFGRFDTDVFSILLELLLILFLTEALRAPTRGKRAAHTAGFALSGVLFFLFWSPTYAAMFVGLTLAGGAIAVPAMMFADPGRRPASAGAFFRRPEIRVILAGGILAAAGLLIVSGPSVFGSIFSALTTFSTTSQTGEGVMPNLFSSIAELSSTGLFPAKTWQMFSGYVAGESPAAVNGAGGALAFLAALAGLVFLILSCFPRAGKVFRREPNYTGANGALYACVLGVWLAACLFLTRSGVRFIEHLSIPVGLLAAAFAGRAVHLAEGRENERQKKREQRRAVIRKALASVLCLAVTVPALSGAARAAADSRPSVSDASANAMAFIRNNAKDEKAVIASWWDMGYFYVSESGHPCLWDGGNQRNSTRAILVSRALVTDDPELSRRILLMLAGSGNAAVDLLREHTDVRTAFETLWTVLPLDGEKCKEILREKLNMTESEAAAAEALIHPAAKETYLIITYTMTQQIGWYEYYSDWDFTGKQAMPAATLYSYTPEGTPLFNTDKGQTYLNSVRGKETMWQLFFAAARTDCFTPAYEWHDGLEHVRVWRVEP